MRSIDLILKAQSTYLPGDFVVYRALPRRELRRIGGFVFLDHFDQTDITPELFDVPPHPHIGLQTVTYLFAGEIQHTDSLDYQQKIRPGDVNWMTSGRGITHAEQAIEFQPRIHGIQSWVGLPHDKRKTEPVFEHFSGSDLPNVSGEGFEITVIAGLFEGLRSPVPTFQDLVYVDISVDEDASREFMVDESHELAVYICEGSVEISGQNIERYDLARLTEGSRFGVAANTRSRFILLGGEPLRDPTIVYWNFVADSVSEAKQAAIDWEEGKFPSVRKYEKITSHSEDEEKKITRLL